MWSSRSGEEKCANSRLTRRHKIILSALISSALSHVTLKLTKLIEILVYIFWYPKKTKFANEIIIVGVINSHDHHQQSTNNGTTWNRINQHYMAVCGVLSHNRPTCPGPRRAISHDFFSFGTENEEKYRLVSRDSCVCLSFIASSTPLHSVKKKA